MAHGTTEGKNILENNKLRPGSQFAVAVAHTQPQKRNYRIAELKLIDSKANCGEPLVNPVSGGDPAYQHRQQARNPKTIRINYAERKKSSPRPRSEAAPPLSRGDRFFYSTN
jgi:hypothetical protein